MIQELNICYEVENGLNCIQILKNSIPNQYENKLLKYLVAMMWDSMCQQPVKYLKSYIKYHFDVTMERCWKCINLLLFGMKNGISDLVRGVECQFWNGVYERNEYLKEW